MILLTGLQMVANRAAASDTVKLKVIADRTATSDTVERATSVR